MKNLFRNKQTLRINNNELILHLRKELKLRQLEGIYAYSKFRGSDEVDFYQSIAGILSMFMMDSLELNNKQRHALQDLIDSFATKNGDGSIFFNTYHNTAILYLLINIVGLGSQYIYPKPINKIENLKTYLEDTVQWEGTLKDLWGILWLKGSYLKEIDGRELRSLVEYFDHKLNVVIDEAAKDTTPVIISKIYHFVSAVEVLNIPQLSHKRIVNTLLGTDYLKQRNNLEINQCTDFDYAYALSDAIQYSGYKNKKVLQCVEDLSYKRVCEYHNSKDFLGELSTSYIFNYLISTGVFQILSRKHFIGYRIPDILNRQELFRRFY